MRLELCSLAILIIMLLSLTTGSEAQEKRSSNQIDAVPSGYNLYAYDDCGIPDRQPHVDMTDAYNFTFALSDTDEPDLKSRSAVFSYKELRINYNDLDPKRSYVLVMTYATDHVYKRIQSLWADGIELHGPMPLPTAKAIRAIVKVPAEVTQDGKMALVIKIHGEVNATASIIELWATGPADRSLRFSSITGIPEGVTGRLIDLGYEGVKDATVRLYPEGKEEPLATTTTDAEGTFRFDEKIWKGKYDDTALRITATSGGLEVSTAIPASDVGFEPVRYRPIPTTMQGLKSHQLSLDGAWKINPSPADNMSAKTHPGQHVLDDQNVRELPLSSKDWASIQVPGQWKQQGFDIPQDKTVAMAREFAIPKEWDGQRIFLRFDAIHAGTDCFVNGKKIGYSENLFTPVEYEITDVARPGSDNRIDLSMKVATVSERLSYSNGYAFHNLGGIDRSVHLFALPKVNLKDMRILTDLDGAYRDAEIKLNVTVDNASKQASKHPEPVEGLGLHVTLIGPNGKAVKISTSSIAVGPLDSAQKTVEASIRVTNPLKWSAEKPHLYRFAIELKQGENVLERVERNLGFRKIEVRGRQVYINGQRVKFAGACHHEFDPLTGRADTMRHGEQDVELAKEINLNYLRTSHYPPTQEFLDAADRLGIYVEVEAPFCWVQPTSELADLRQVLTPTSAMIDYCHTHPSVIIWSIANESNFNDFFEYSDKLIKELDPTRLTTFNNPDPKEICDITNAHYPLMPYDNVLKDDPRPLFLGEYWFPVCHEQTDVSINPGLRELWGHGQADPDSAYAKEFARTSRASTIMPGAFPGTWSYIYHSDRVIGGAIWALIDEPFYFKDGMHAGYAWHHGFWGLIDAWRRPKPEAWLSKLIFSPVWFPQRDVTFIPGQESVSVPVENRYSFTDLKELVFSWEIGKKRGKAKASVAPGTMGSIQLPVPMGTAVGDQITLRVTDKQGEIINAVAIHLGKEKLAAIPLPTGGAPKWTDDGKTIVIEGGGFSLAIDRKTGDLDPTNPKHKAAIMSFPALHLTRHDYGDLNGPNSPPYAVFPDVKTRVVDEVSAIDRGKALEIRVKDHYDGFSGFVTWLIDKNGISKASYDYTYTGPHPNPLLGGEGVEMDGREVGMSVLLKPRCDELRWKRWSEWGDVFPADSISRTEGVAKSRRPKELPDVPDTTKPSWSWALDQTELGTNDFRSIKFNIYNASLVAADGSGVEALSDGAAHVRACLTNNGVKMHILQQCPMGPIKLKSGDVLKGEFTIALLTGAKR